MRWVWMLVVLTAGQVLFRYWLDAPNWGALIGAYVLWLVVRPKEWI